MKLMEVHHFKACAMIAVLMVHSTSFGILWYPAQSTGAFLLSIVNRAFAFGTPCFILISAFLFLYAYGERSWHHIDWRLYWKKRWRIIVIPYIFFSIFYYVWNHAQPSISFQEHAHNVWLHLIHGSAHTHLYFIIVILQFYLILPPLLYLFQRFSQWQTTITCSGIVLHLTFLIINHEFHWVSQKGSLFISYLSFFLIGAWLGVRYRRWRSYLLRPLHKKGGVIATFCVWSTLAGTIYIFAWYFNHSKLLLVHPLVIEFAYLCYIPAIALVVFQIVHLIPVSTPPRFQRWLTLLGTRAYGIYFIHPLLLQLYRETVDFVHTPLTFGVWLGGSFALALFISYIVVGWFHSLKHLQLIPIR